MKGIILAGGTGSRLYPLTLVTSKQLQAVFDKPMIYYPLTTLIENGVKEICIISTPHDLPLFQKLLGDGSRLGITLEYREQKKPEGIAQAFIIAESFIGNNPVALILGDNIFYGGTSIQQAFNNFKGGATVFAYKVSDPERYGVVEFDKKGRVVSIEEKPVKPKSSYAIPGLYLYDKTVAKVARALKPSKRGELEITDLHNHYLRLKKITVHKLEPGFVWLDAGTPTSLSEASNYVETVERRHNIKIGSPEHAALCKGFISTTDMRKILKSMPACDYRHHLSKLLEK